ncbi:hypothetical protein [Dongia deserti]|uniref:hypothetical protein n=1 Tax=Dongia deserti TaxID=2268030 RepID=UPI000E6479D1|nr:hypothetical protein [Dongia deserti]
MSLYLSVIIVSAAGEKGKEAAQPLNLFLDITSNRLADEVDMNQKRRLNVAGVPVVVGGKRQNGDAAPSVAAGVTGSHKFELGNNMSLKPSGVVSRTHIDGDGILSSGRFGGDAAFQYQEGGSGLLLRPSLYATMQRDVLERMDYALEGKLWQEIGRGVDLTATLGQSWRVSELLYTDNRESTYGWLGVKIDLFDKSALELAYGFNTTDGPLPSQYRFSQGPGVTAHLVLAPGWRIDSSYKLTTTERGYTDQYADARRHDLRHLLKLRSDWQISTTTGAEWHISAGYDYDRTLTDAPVTTPANHIASMNFGLNF